MFFIKLKTHKVIMIFNVSLGNPSPFDRKFGTVIGVTVCSWLIEQVSKETPLTFKDQDTACVIGLRSEGPQFQSVEKLKAETDFKYRRW